MAIIFPKSLEEIDYPLPTDFEGALDDNEYFLRLLGTSDHLLSKRANDFRKASFTIALRILSVPFINRSADKPADVEMIRQEIEEAYSELSLEELEALAIYYGLGKHFQADLSQQFFKTGTEGESIHYRTAGRIIINALLADVEIELARLKTYFQYGVSKEYWREMYETENEGDGAIVDQLVIEILE
jgi:hypothetical protein